MVIVPCVSCAQSEGDSAVSAPPGNEMPGGGTPPDGNPPDGAPGGGPGSDASSVSWSGATKISSGTTEDGKTYASTSANENALLVDTSDSVTLTNSTVTKSGGTS